MPALPSSLALGNIADGALIVASDHRNNYAAIQAAVNALIADLSGGSAGALLQALSSSSIGYLPDTPIDKNALVFDAASGRWKPQGGALYRKATTKTVNNTITETDLLNGEITVAGNALGVSSVLRLTAWGDWKQNSGGATDVPRFKLKLGATTLLDTSVLGAAIVPNQVTRFGWRICCEIMNLGAANVQWATLSGELICGVNTVFGVGGFAVGEGDTLTIMTSATQGAGAKYLGSNSGAVDTTAAQALVLSTILPVASANTEILLKGALVEII